MKRGLIALAAAALFALPATAEAAAPVEIRQVDLQGIPQVHLTLVAPAGVRPMVFEGGRPAEFATARQLGSAEALVLAIDNSKSMRGRPLREAKRAADQFLFAQGQRASALGLVAFAHESLSLTRSNESSGDIRSTLSALAPDSVPGTALYDAVVSSVARLQRLSPGARILVLLTDGRDVGSGASLEDAVAAAKAAHVTVYAIAAGTQADKRMLAMLAGPTGGRVFDAADVSRLSAAYAALGNELDRTWRIGYLTSGRPGDTVALRVRAGKESAQLNLRIPGSSSGGSGPIPGSIIRDQGTLIAVVMLAALLVAAAGAGLAGSRRAPEIRRLLDPHVKRRDHQEAKAEQKKLFEPVFDWTEDALADLPGSGRLTRLLERSGLRLRPGHVPFLCLAGALVFGALGTALAVGSGASLVLMLLGFTSPLIVVHVIATRRAKAFDRQLPDLLATVASTLRAGHGLRTALRAVADDGSPPVSQELARVLGEERLGRPLDEAIEAMCERTGSEDMEYVATAINVQSQAGGSLATLFDTLSETVRERQRHARKVHALTSMGRMSATILICLPFGLAALMTLISPSYMAPFYETSTGHALIAFCLGSMTIGALLLKRIVNVRY